MLDKSVRVKREELRKKSVSLKGMALDEKSDKIDEIRYKQHELYEKWDFYNNLIKSIERMEGNEMQDKKNRKR